MNRDTVWTVFILLAGIKDTSASLECGIVPDGLKILPDFITCFCDGIGSVFQVRKGVPIKFTNNRVIMGIQGDQGSGKKLN
jgi:hypothetical protein